MGNMRSMNPPCYPCAFIVHLVIYIVLWGQGRCVCCMCVESYDYTVSHFFSGPTMVVANTLHEDNAMTDDSSPMSSVALVRPLVGASLRCGGSPHLPTEAPHVFRVIKPQALDSPHWCCGGTRRSHSTFATSRTQCAPFGRPKGSGIWRSHRAFAH